MLCFALMHSKTETHYLLNTWHGSFGDVFFQYVTYLGSGLPTYIGIAVLLFSVRKGVFILSSQLLSFLITHGIKEWLNIPRPSTLFNELGITLPQTVAGVDLHTWKSFPSGHTCAAFAFCFCVAVMIPKKYNYLKVLLLILGISGAYSRIYLSQHFLEDTLAGSMIGVLSVIALYFPIYKNKWGEYPLFRFKKQKKWAALRIKLLHFTP